MEEVRCIFDNVIKNATQIRAAFLEILTIFFSGN